MTKEKEKMMMKKLKRLIMKNMMKILFLKEINFQNQRNSKQSHDILFFSSFSFPYTIYSQYNTNINNNNLNYNCIFSGEIISYSAADFGTYSGGIVIK